MIHSEIIELAKTFEGITNPKEFIDKLADLNINEFNSLIDYIKDNPDLGEKINEKNNP